MRMLASAVYSEFGIYWQESYVIIFDCMNSMISFEIETSKIHVKNETAIYLF